MPKLKAGEVVVRKTAGSRIVKLSYGKSTKRKVSVMKPRPDGAVERKPVDTDALIREADEHLERVRLRPVG